MSKMIKTSSEICKKCLYGGGHNGCNYLLMEYKTRGCPLGLCDKYRETTKEDKIKDRKIRSSY